MKFKKTTTACLLALATILSIGSYAAPGSNEVIPVTTPATAPASPEVQQMLNRLEEIKAMDHKNMPRSEKRKYAKEVKQIQKKMNAIGGGVYISAGALILILVLLIIFL
ncbi:MAG TPA: hypothetical protein VK508_22190 [Cyclobacteriaceae bacterium]|nr:hypothetical protein [Cyclobacteriaceae bacterium]